MKGTIKAIRKHGSHSKPFALFIYLCKKEPFKLILNIP